MTKKIILLLIFSQFCFSQNHYSISVKYKTIVTTIKTDSTTTKHKDLVQEIINSAQNKTFLLTANNQGFLFEEEASIQNDERKKSIEKISSITFSLNSCFYEKKKNQLFLISNNLSIKSKHLYEWKLVNETKKIDNYTCYKAIYNDKFLTRKGEEVNRLITAWYTPEISINYGPNGYIGLPGLILELEYDKIKLAAKEIKIFKENLKIDLPRNKQVTEEEYLKKISEN